MTPEDAKLIAVDVYNCALSWEPNARLLGNVTALQIGALCRHVIEAAARPDRAEVERMVADLKAACVWEMSEAILSDPSVIDAEAALMGYLFPKEPGA